MKSILLSTLVCLVPLGAFAQDSQRQPRRVVLPPAGARPVVKARPAQDPGQAQPSVPGLSKNVTITLKGELQGLVPVDLELTGCGPEYLTDYNIKKAADSDLPASIVTINVTLTEIEGGFYASYSAGARVAIVTETQSDAGGGRKTIEFRELILRGSARVKLGEPVILSKIDGKTLQLTVSEAE